MRSDPVWPRLVCAHSRQCARERTFPADSHRWIHPAIDDCKVVLAQQPDNLKIRNRLGAGLLKVGSLTQSNEAYRYVEDKAAELRESTGNAAEAEAALKCEQDAKEGIKQVYKLKDAMERAYGAQRRSLHDEAVRQAELAIAIAPHDHCGCVEQLHAGLRRSGLLGGGTLAHWGSTLALT